MHVLIYQQFHPGHHYRYLVPLLPALVSLGCRVTVCLTPEGRASREFDAYLAPLVGPITVDATLPSGLPRMVKSEHWKLHTDVRAAVTRHRPDHVLIPSGDPHIAVMGAFRLTGAGALPGRVPVEIGVHWGQGSPGAGKARIKDTIQLAKLRAAGAHRLHVVNFLFQERLRALGGSFARSCVVMPQPVAPNPGLGRSESRVALSLPTDGRLISLVGAIDARKSVAETIKALRAARAAKTDRLVIAGNISPDQLDRITEAGADLTDEGSLIVRNGFVSESDYAKYLTASDVVCLPYRGFSGLSAVLFEAVAAGRPVLAHRWDWSEAVIRRFQLGWTCDVADAGDYARSLTEALQQSAGYTHGPSAARLLAFNTPENFSATWLQFVVERAGYKTHLQPKPWHWVVGGSEQS